MPPSSAGTAAPPALHPKPGMHGGPVPGGHDALGGASGIFVNPVARPTADTLAWILERMRAMPPEQAGARRRELTAAARVRTASVKVKAPRIDSVHE